MKVNVRLSVLVEGVMEVTKMHLNVTPWGLDGNAEDAFKSLLHNESAEGLSGILERRK